MDGDINETIITLGGHVEIDKYRFFYFVVILIVYVLIVWLNSTILFLIYSRKNLHEPMYIFIAGLLINSLLFSSVVLPKLLFDVLSERQIVSYVACVGQFHLFYSLAASEFLLLTAMAYDRYVSICRPLQYPTIMTKTTISILLALAWILPTLQMAVPTALIAKKKLCNFTLKGIFCDNFVYRLHCSITIARLIRDLVILLNVALLPMFFILFTYIRILLISYRSSREVKKKAAQTCLPHLIVLLNFSCLCAFHVIIVQLESNIPKTVQLAMTLQIVMYPPLLNPIIYGLKMKAITQHLKSLFKFTQTCLMC